MAVSFTSQASFGETQPLFLSQEGTNKDSQDTGEFNVQTGTEECFMQTQKLNIKPLINQGQEIDGQSSIEKGGKGKENKISTFHRLLG